MVKQFNRNLQWGYGFSIVMLILVGYISYQAIVTLLNSNREVSHSALVIQKLEKTLSEMKDAETGQRGYLLTGKQQYLEPYNGAVKSALSLITDAEQLTVDNPSQQKNIVTIKAIVAERMAILSAMINKKQNGLAVSDADLDAGKTAMDALRRAVDKAERDEDVLLAERSDRFDRYTTVAPYFIIGAVLLSVVIALVSYVKAVRLNAELEDKEVQTASFNEELTAANEEVTAANEELTAINEELSEAREELVTLNNSLEDKVMARTKELEDSEEETQALNEELTAMNEELSAMNEELMATNEDLAISREKLQATFNELVTAKTQVEKSEKLFSSIARNIPGTLVIAVDKDQKVLALEGDKQESFGLQPGNHTGQYIADVAIASRYEAVKAMFDRMLLGEQFWIEHTDLEGADYKVDFVPLFDGNKEIYAGLVVCLDITDIKKAEERAAKLAAIVESSDDAIIGKTLDGIVTSWNRGAEHIFGYTEDEVIGQSILKLIPEERHYEEPIILGRLRNGERIERYETKRMRSDGHLIDVSLTISPIRNSAGAIIGVSKIARDVSEQKKDEQRKNDFIGMASHELKTPLTSLSALAQVLNKKLAVADDPFVPAALEKINGQIRKMTGMINGFLNISRLESGKLAIDPQPFDLNDLIAEIISEVKLTVTSHELNFTPAQPIIINADHYKIGSVISNLLSNAVKYSPKGKHVNITVLTEDSRQVQVSVQDEGMGIKQADIDNLFDRYYRVTTEHTKHISGFGVGLYLSAEIINRHGGKIWVESEKGVGSTFHFTLPLA
jgi:PAS domain S-box-containing protein